MAAQVDAAAKFELAKAEAARVAATKATIAHENKKRLDWEAQKKLEAAALTQRLELSNDQVLEAERVALEKQGQENMAKFLKSVRVKYSALEQQRVSLFQKTRTYLKDKYKKQHKAKLHQVRAQLLKVQKIKTDALKKKIAASKAILDNTKGNLKKFKNTLGYFSTKLKYIKDKMTNEGAEFNSMINDLKGMEKFRNHLVKIERLMLNDFETPKMADPEHPKGHKHNKPRRAAPVPNPDFKAPQKALVKQTQSPHDKLMTVNQDLIQDIVGKMMRQFQPHKRSHRQMPREEVRSTENKTPASAEMLEEPRLPSRGVFMNVGKDDIYIPDRAPENEHRYKTKDLWNSDRMAKALDQEDMKNDSDQYSHLHDHGYLEDAGQENDVKPKPTKMLRTGMISAPEETM